MRALIGRDRDDALQQALEARGIECLFVRLLDIEPVAVADLEARLARARAVLLTSANALPALAQARRDLPVLAVGDATALRIREAGFVDVHSADGDVAALARLARERIDPALGPLLYLRGAEVAGNLAEGLPHFEIDQAVVYRARPASRLPAAILQELANGTIDLVLLFSPRSASGFVSLLQRTGLAERCARMTLLALSPAVAQAAQSLPWAASHVGAHPSRDGLLAMIDTLIGTRDLA